MSTISIIIPVYNEEKTIPTILGKLEQVQWPHNYIAEIVIVDDGSTDGSREIIRNLPPRYITILKDRNEGKGAAIRTGLAKSTGKYVVIQDADLEYGPHDLARMLSHMIDNNLSVLYGSRRRDRPKVHHSGFIFFIGGYILTVITNILFQQHLTDEPTCYKMFQGSLLRSWPLTCKRFEFCPEVTAYAAKNGIQIPEIPIAYFPRTAAEGKKINYKDWFEAVWTLLRIKFL
ncbi:MAG: glycosyl transferase family 2 [Candidatus Kaiserbacteria bacterium]|nr:glycosyl transferase family 2 [Candidatus Kaiserbacteria bacterium]